MNKCKGYLTDRKTGIDLIKIVAMLFITAAHYIGYSGLLENKDTLLVNNVLFTWIFILARAAINLFAVITGYLLSQKSFSFRRIARIWFDVIFISLCGLTIAMSIGNIPSKGVLLKSLLPVTTFSYWYVNTHFLLLCVAPLLNMLVNKWNAQIHFKMCCVLTAVCTIFFTMNPFVNAEIYIGHGHGIVWFSVLYLWGGCFARQDLAFSKRNAAIFGLIAQMVLLALSYLQEKLPVVSKFNLLEMNSLFMVTIALSIFTLLKDISVRGKVKKFLNAMAGASLFVYLIQEHNALREVFWSLFKTTELAGSYYIWIDFMLAMTCLWPVAYLIRKVTLRIWPCFEGIMKYLNQKIKLVK